LRYHKRIIQKCVYDRKREKGQKKVEKMDKGKKERKTGTGSFFG